MAIPIEMPEEYQNTQGKCHPESLVLDFHQNSYNQQQHMEKVVDFPNQVVDTGPAEPVSSCSKTMDFAVKFVKEILAAFQPQLPSNCTSEPISVYTLASGHLRFRTTRKRASSKLIIKYTSESLPVLQESVSGVLPDIVTSHNTCDPNNSTNMRLNQSKNISFGPPRNVNKYKNKNYGVERGFESKCVKPHSTVTFPSSELSISSLPNEHCTAVGRSLRFIADNFEIQKLSRQENKRTSTQLTFLGRYEKIVLQGIILLFEIF